MIGVKVTQSKDNRCVNFQLLRFRVMVAPLQADGRTIGWHLLLVSISRR